MALEREIKLAFADSAQARTAVVATGATLLRIRRLQEDYLLDTSDEILRRRRCLLRIRMDGGRSFVTFKGPVQPGAMKVREEIETAVSDGETVLRVLEQLGFRVWFRYQKYREEYTREDVIAAIDETPIGTFVEIEGSERGIVAMADALARPRADYVTDSYRGLFVRYCKERGLPDADMVFEQPV